MWYTTLMTTALKEEIKKLARESVREALAEEFMKARAGVLPLVSKKEQADIEELYAKPSRKGAKVLRIHI